MELLILRHAHAVAVGAEGVQSDADRFLTAEGKRKAKESAAFLAKVGPRVDRIYSSPLVRALQTAEVARKVMGVRRRVVCLDQLAPGKWCMGKGGLPALEGNVCLLVGHNPDLEELATFCLGGRGRALLEIRKAGICWLSFEDRPSRGAGVLRLLMPAV